MQVVIRKYSGNGSKELLDLLEKNRAEIEATLRKVQGFVSYTLARTESGGFSVTVCQAQAGIDESTKVAREWIAKNGRSIAVGPPEVTLGSVISHVN